MASSSSATRSFKEYTIGWICALAIEAAAATAMLDEEHQRPPDFAQPRQDTNVYTWGNIGIHNVVIATLPAGEYGTTSASNVATTLLMSFPEVRFGLMVGIGAGVPRPGKDIRLGDVVVSEPKGTSGGVVQYDFVKAIQDVVNVFQGGKLQRIGMLNKPPTVLLNAVSALKKQHEMRRYTRIPEFLQDMVKRFPGMGEQEPESPAYIYQEAHNDRLFEASYGHAGDGDCASICDLSRVKSRTPRPSNDPKIHYGVIASGNTLVKNATTREVLARQTGEDCICFEMEAAGLMNTFPCLVIRGICDYADSHKNDTWQRYAAATAAACARELFPHIPAQELSSSKPAQDMLGQSERNDNAAGGAPPLPATPVAQQSPSYYSPPTHQQSGPDLGDLIAQVAALNHRIQNLKATDLTNPSGSNQPAIPPGTPHHQSWTSEPQHLRDEVGKLDGQIAEIEKLLKGLSTRAPQPSIAPNPPSVTPDRSGGSSRPSTASVGIFSRTSLDESFARDPVKFRRIIEQFFKGPWPRFVSDWGASRLKRIEKEVMQPLGVGYSIRYRDTFAWADEGLPLNERLRGFIASLDNAADPKSLSWKVYNQSILSLGMVCEEYLGHEVFRR